MVVGPICLLVFAFDSSLKTAASLVPAGLFVKEGA
jgi:hypothetical protein